MKKIKLLLTLLFVLGSIPFQGQAIALGVEPEYGVAPEYKEVEVFADGFESWSPGYTNNWNVVGHATGEWGISHQAIEGEKSLKFWSWQIWPYDAYVQLTRKFPPTISSPSPAPCQTKLLFYAKAANGPRSENIIVYVNGQELLRVTPNLLSSEWQEFTVAVPLGVRSISFKINNLVMASSILLDDVRLVKTFFPPPGTKTKRSF